MHAVPPGRLEHDPQRTELRVAVDRWSPLRELEALADALPLLIARDDERPRTWSLPAFIAQVAATRASLAGPTAVRTLAAHLRPVDVRERVDGPPFEQAARRLARDAEAVGLAIRWLEIETDARLPSWPELLRRRSVPGAGDAVIDAGLWFG
jgi:hypothetical protein